MVHGSGKKLILASSSPRRQVLLQEARIDFTVVAPPMDEPPIEVMDLSPRQQAEALSYFKARAVVQMRRRDGTDDDTPILAADTLVALGEHIFGKPAGADDAARMLAQLSAHPHQVITGVCIIHGRKRLIASDVTTVHMRSMTGEEIDAYLASGEWEGKAGAYGIQGAADRFVTELEGSFSNVVGLPVELVQQMLKTVRSDETI